MSIKSIGYALILIGVLALAGSLLADILGVGKDPSGIGPLQLLGAAGGLLLAVLGGFLVVRPGNPKK